MKFGLINNFSSELAQDLPVDGNVMVLSYGAEKVQKALASADMVALTLVGGDSLEIVHATSVIGQSVTVIRGQEGTSAGSYLGSDGVVVEARATAATLSSGPVNADLVGADKFLMVGNSTYSTSAVGGGISSEFIPQLSYLDKYSFVTDIGTQELRTAKESNTGRYLYTSAKNNATQYSSLVFDTATGDQLLKSSFGSNTHFDGIFSPDDSYLVVTVTYEDAFVVYDTTSWTEVVIRTPADMGGRGDLTSPDDYWGIRGGAFIDNTRILLLPEFDQALNVSKGGADPATHFFIYDIATDTFTAPSVQGPEWLTGSTVYVYPRNVKLLPSRNKAAVVYQWGDTPVGLVVFDYDQVDGTWQVNIDIHNNLLAAGNAYGHCDFVGLVGDRYLWVKHSSNPVGNGMPPFYVVDLDTNEVFVNSEETSGPSFYAGSDSGAVLSGGRHVLIGYEDVIHIYDALSLDLLGKMTLPELQSAALDEGVAESSSEFGRLETGSSGTTYLTMKNGKYVYGLGGESTLYVANHRALQGLATLTHDGMYLGPGAAAADNGVAIGAASSATGARSSSFGVAATSSGPASSAIGSAAIATGDSSVAAGYKAHASGASSVAVGRNSVAEDRSVALGFRAKATISGGMVTSATPYVPSGLASGVPAVSAIDFTSGELANTDKIHALEGADFVPDSYELISLGAFESPYRYPLGWQTVNEAGYPKSFGSNTKDNAPQVLYSPSGKLLVTSSGGRVVFADPESSAVYRILYVGTTEQSPKDSLAAVFTPDGRYLIVSNDQYDGHLYKIDLSSFEMVDIRASTGGLAISMDVSPDGRYLAVGHEESPGYEIFDLTTHQKLPTPYVPNGTCRGVKFTPDGKYLILASTKQFGYAGLTSSFDSGYYHVLSVGVWAPLPDAAALSDTPPTQLPYDLAISPDGTLVAAACYGLELFVFSTDTWARVPGAPTGYPAGVTTGKCLAFSSDGQYLAVGHTRTQGFTVYRVADWTIAYEVNQATYPEFFRTPDGTSWDSDDKSLCCITFSPDGGTVNVAQQVRPSFASFDLANNVVNTPTQPDIMSDVFGGATICSATDTVYVATSSSKISVYRLIDSKWTRLPDSDELVITSAVSSLSVNNDGSLLAVAYAGLSDSVKVYSTIDWSEQLNTPVIASANHVSFSPDGAMLAVRTDTTITVLSAADWSVLHTDTAQSITGTVMFTPDSAKLIFTDTLGVQVRLVSDWSVVSGLENIGNATNGVSVAVDSLTLALPVANDTVVRLYDLSLMEEKLAVDVSMLPGKDNSSATYNSLTGLTFLGATGYALVTTNGHPAAAIVDAGTLAFDYTILQPRDVYTSETMSQATNPICSYDGRHALWRFANEGTLALISTDYATDKYMRVWGMVGNTELFAQDGQTLDCTSMGSRVITEGSYAVAKSTSLMAAPNNAHVLRARLVARGYYLQGPEKFDWLSVGGIVRSGLPTVTCVAADATGLAFGIEAAPYVRYVDTTTGIETPIDTTPLMQSAPTHIALKGNLLAVGMGSGSDAAPSVGVIDVSLGTVIPDSLPAYSVAISTLEFSSQGDLLYVMVRNGHDMTAFNTTTWAAAKVYASPSPGAFRAYAWPVDNGVYYCTKKDISYVPDDGRPPVLRHTFPVYVDNVARSTSSDGRYTLLAYYYGSDSRSTVSLWDNFAGKEVFTPIEIFPRVTAVAILPGDDFALLFTEVPSNPRPVVIYDMSTGQEVGEYMRYPAQVDSVVVDADKGTILLGGQAVTSTSDNGLVVLEALTYEERENYSANTYTQLN